MLLRFYVSNFSVTAHRGNIKYLDRIWDYDISFLNLDDFNQILPVKCYFNFLGSMLLTHFSFHGVSLLILINFVGGYTVLMWQMLLTFRRWILLRRWGQLMAYFPSTRRSLYRKRKRNFGRDTEGKVTLYASWQKLGRVHRQQGNIISFLLFFKLEK
jgi:hypothetical protein